MSAQQEPAYTHRSLMYWNVFEDLFFSPTHSEAWQLQFNRDVRAVRTRHSKEFNTHNVAMCPMSVAVEGMRRFLPMPPAGLSIAGIQEYNKKYLEWRDAVIDAVTYKKLYSLISPYSTIHILYMGEDTGHQFATYKVVVPVREGGAQLIDITRDIPSLMGWPVKTISRKNINTFTYIPQTHLRPPLRQVAEISDRLFTDRTLLYCSFSKL
jgi:hypothetical protein